MNENDPQPLTSAPCGAVLLVNRVGVDGREAVRLKRMGICEGRQIQLVQAGDPLIVRVVGCRVGVSRQLAAEVLTTPCAVCNDPVENANQQPRPHETASH